MEQTQLKELQILCAKVRIDIFEMLVHCGQGHLGGAMSLVETMAVLYGKQLHVDPQDPHMEDRDKVVLSKGHAGPVWYATLAEKGFFPKDWLFTLNQGGTNLPSHPDRLKTPGVDMTTGSLGQGTSSAAGIATGQKLKGSNRYTYLIVGDGELNEGQCWEAFQYLANNKLNHCIVIIDDNKRQLDGYTKDVMNPFSISDKMKAFGFHTQVVKGDDLEAIDDAIETAKQVQNQAVCIVLDSTKGRSVKYFEDMKANHSVKFNNDEVIQEAKKAIAGYKAWLKEEQ
ncbi:transketolase [Absicoccus porci]|jgi:transketolase|uniref:transketolase n=1 Tax=Absicoccus porci TaxID=2486576 RepID=UPI003D90248B